MSERKCLMTFYPTDCKEDCFNCKCGGAEATKDMYVSIHNVQRVCSITGSAADTDEGEHIAEVIRNNLESMVVSAKLVITPGNVEHVKHGRWLHFNNENFIFCSECEHEAYRDSDNNQHLFDYCPYCGAKMI